MHPAVIKAIELILLTSGYAAVDWAIRQDGFLRLLRRLRIGGLANPILLCSAPALSPFWTWQALPAGNALRILSLALALMLAWKASTQDIDPVVGEAHGASRLLLLAAATGLWFSPAFLPVCVFLLTTPFGLWQHHSTLPMRLLQALTALTALMALAAALAPSPLLAAAPAQAPMPLPAAMPLFQDTATAVFFLLTMAISHYLITALAKIYLGPKWYSWVTDNRMHHLAASAYSWGWARFLPWSAWLRVIGAVRVAERPLQALAFGLELLSPLALLDARLAIAFCLAWAAFHAGVFLCSGLLFWDWILTDLALAGFILLLPGPLGSPSAGFGALSVAASLAFLALFPLRHKLWKPMPLGWFDTPFTQRVHWRVRGASGRLYGLYNDFMCPHERLYGKVHGCFLAPVPVITYHLGEVWKPALRDAIRDAGPDLARLEAVRDRFGILPRCEKRSADHQAYLRRFFHALNRGARKQVLPRALCWMKAPGDQVYYWGDLPAYRGQERAARIILLYREEYFDGRELVRLREDPLLDIAIGTEEPPDCAREPTPKEIDDFLLGFAAGRLIDLPGFGGGFVKGDDGKRSPAPESAGRSRAPF